MQKYKYKIQLKYKNQSDYCELFCDEYEELEYWYKFADDSQIITIYNNDAKILLKRSDIDSMMIRDIKSDSVSEIK